MNQSRKSISLDQLREAVARRQGTYTTDQRCPDCWLVHPLYFPGMGCAVRTEDYKPIGERVNWSADHVSQRRPKRSHPRVKVQALK